MFRRHGPRGFAREEGAQALVEFAFILPIFLLLVTGIFDSARAVWQENTLAFAAREGTRFAIVHGTGGNPVAGPCAGSFVFSCVNPSGPNVNNLDQVVSAVTTNAVGVYGITVTITYPGVGPVPIEPCNYRTCPVIVDAIAPFVPLPSQYMLGGAFQITLRGGSKLYIQR